MASYGYDDSSKSGWISTSWDASSISLLDPHAISKHRGFTLVELDPKTCTMRNRQRFDTYALAVDREQLLDTLQSATAGTIIIGVTADSAEHDTHLRNAVNWYFTKYSMNLEALGLQLRDKFAFVIQKGFPKKTVCQRKAKGGEYLGMRIAVRGKL